MAQEHLGSGELVFPGSRADGPIGGFQWLFNRIVALGSLPSDVSPHVLRHSVASVAADQGYSEPTIATLVGHVGVTMTSRYVHGADAVLLAADDRVAGESANALR